MTELARLDGYLKKEKNPHSNDCQFSTLFLSVVASQHWLSKGSFLSSVCEKTLTQSCSMSGIDTFKIKKKKERKAGRMVGDCASSKMFQRIMKTRYNSVFKIFTKSKR